MNDSSSRYDPASFKDPSGRVYVKNGRIFRALSEEGARAWAKIKENKILDPLTARGLVVDTWEAGDEAGSPAERPVLEHRRIPFLSFAYEWPPHLLKKAALLHLQLMEDLLPRGFLLKDSTPFNVQFDGVHPVLIDVLSIEKRVEGDPWAGYGQFCDTMLYPLMLAAYKRVPYHDWLRGSPAGFSPESFARLFTWRDSFRKGVFSHVKLRAALHRRTAASAPLNRDDIRSAGFPLSSLQRIVASLKSSVEALFTETGRGKSPWAAYAEDNSYSPAAAAAKKAFVDRVVAGEKPGVLWDIGCNTGEFSKIVSHHATMVVALDADADVVDVLAKACSKGGPKNVLPLVMDFSNPSPSLGWAAQERPSLFERGKPDVILALALIHHLAVSKNVPLDEQLKLFSRLGRTVVIEYVDRHDPMFQRLLTNVGIRHDDYNRENFLRLSDRYFERVASETLTATREIFVLRSKSWVSDSGAD